MHNEMIPPTWHDGEGDVAESWADLVSWCANVESWCVSSYIEERQEASRWKTGKSSEFTIYTTQIQESLFNKSCNSFKNPIGGDSSYCCHIWKQINKQRTETLADQENITINQQKVFLFFFFPRHNFYLFKWKAGPKINDSHLLAEEYIHVVVRGGKARLLSVTSWERQE